MGKKRKATLRIAGRSLYTTCRAVFHYCYATILLILGSLTLFAAYVATLDDIPVPQFLIRELRENLKTKGLQIRMEGIRFQPNGRVAIEAPQLYSPELGSPLLKAEYAVAKLRLSHLFLGRVAIDELRISSGELIIPAMLTPSGTPSTAVHSINMEAHERGDTWQIDYAHLAIDELKLSLHGTLDTPFLKSLIPPPNESEQPKPTAAQITLSVAPKISQFRQQLKKLSQPTAVIACAIEDGQQSFDGQLSATSLRPTPDIEARELELRFYYKDNSPLDLSLALQSATLPQGVSIGQLQAATAWPSLPTAQDYLPESVQLALHNLAYRDLSVPSLVATLEPGASSHTAHASLALEGATASLSATHFIDSKETSLELQATLSDSLVDTLAPFAEQLAKTDIRPLAHLEQTIDLSLSASFSPEFKPLHANALAQSGPVELIGAHIDRARVRAAVEGQQINVPEIQLRSGQQSGVIKIGYNLDTRFRRILVEGGFDPTMINGWFKEWWTAMWDGMTFPADGMLTYLDSQATFLKPETVVVTGLGYAQNIDLRGLDAEEFRTRLYARFHYVDLYQIELLTHDNQQAFGNIQFHMDRDYRDDKDKLTGMWIDAVSTLDVKNAPDIIWEIADDSRRILEPYCYQTNPFIVARSASTRHRDEYSYDIDLEIETQDPFAFYGFPFDSLSTFVHVGDDTVDVPNAQASLGGGTFHASAFILGDELRLDTRLVHADFGQTLLASNTYFARDGSETAQSMDTSKLLAYGGTINANFDGAGILGDTHSYFGDGDFEIRGADFGKFQMLGLLSMALEVTPLRFTTLKFDTVKGPFTVDRTHVRFGEASIEGPVASIRADGSYNIETDALDFKARLFPFRNSKLPLITPLINLPLNIVSNALEVTIAGTFSQPQLRLFNPSTNEQIDVDSQNNIPPRDQRPQRR